MGREKRKRSVNRESSSESENSEVRRHRRCSRYRSEREKSNSDRNERRSYPRSPARRRINADEDVDNRLSRVELLLETLIKRGSESASREERSVGAVRYAVRSDCIPEFEPGNPNLSASKWLEKIDQLAAINDWDDRTTIYHMQNRLSGLARNWYSNLSSYERSWEEWKELIKKSFPVHHDFASSLRKLVNREKLKSESMTEYYFAKMDLLQACKITGKDAVSCLIDGLRDSTIKNGARAGRYKTPEELYSEFLADVNVTEKDHSYDERRRMDKTYETNKNKKVLMNKSDITKIVKCYNCGEKGHISTKCKKPKVECRNCNRLGHTAGDCSRTAKTTVKCVQSQPSDKNKCYFVNCSVNGKMLRGYIDTGCSAVLIKESDAFDLNLTVEPCSLFVKGYGGGKAKVIGKTVVKLKVDLAEVETEVLVIPDSVQNVSVLVGQTFFYIYKNECLSVCPL